MVGEGGGRIDVTTTQLSESLNYDFKDYFELNLLNYRLSQKLNLMGYDK